MQLRLGMFTLNQAQENVNLRKGKIYTFGLFTNYVGKQEGGSQPNVNATKYMKICTLYMHSYIDS